MNYIPTTREMRWYKQAKRESKKSTHDKAHVGAVIVIGNYVVSRGFNKTKTHPRQAKLDREQNYHCPNAKLHAEVSALLNSGKVDLSNAEIYVYREDKHGNIANSKPCVSCTEALRVAGVREVFYTTTEGYAFEVR